MSLIALLIFIAGASVSDVEQWQTYENPKFGYEIRYPDGFEVRPTGPLDKRDGRSIRIALREHAAPTPVMDIHVQEQGATLEPLTTGELPDMDVTTGDVKIGGIQGRQLEYRWKSNGEIAFFILYVDNVVIEFHADSGIRDMRKTIWWKVIETLRFRRK